MSEGFDTPGFFGKAITHGDFLSRRLPASFLDRWDDWLQRGLHASRQQLGADWLGAYLTSPVWRFVLGRGVCGERTWAGVMMPGIDRVGRYFPLTIAASCGVGVDLVEWIGASGEWYERLDVLARSTLDECFQIDSFDAALARLIAPTLHEARAEKAKFCLPLASLSGDELIHGAHTLMIDLLQTCAAGLSFWWSEGGMAGEAVLVGCEGLPAERQFCALVGAGWEASGWTILCRGPAR
ncbi:type VI secretion system-associated protein TagF [Paraburkholderia lacunae]|uniref:Type VI secretion system-associated protein TagF n=1 Tax=Paraburkholderia lacunae TaxID=2211104 RepID=A0A370NA17_9BURK|nr:type VI secretion system-associated protein TagF [Paraburkholderia lacunae]RDK02442.1 type VI secretion system-associated protein TagF [Paraburkholderia lacunae]